MLYREGAGVKTPVGSICVCVCVCERERELSEEAW
jgi:hypothetical protein